MSLLCLSLRWPRYLSPLTSFLSYIYSRVSIYLPRVPPCVDFRWRIPCRWDPGVFKNILMKIASLVSFFFSCIESLAANLNYANTYCYELVEAVDHPAYVIQDDIEVVPFWPSFSPERSSHDSDNKLCSPILHCKFRVVPGWYNIIPFVFSPARTVIN